MFYFFFDNFWVSSRDKIVPIALFKEFFFGCDLTKCSKRFAGCAGRGNSVCPTCNANQEPGFYKENLMTQCSACHGRGLIAHKDGSDSM